MGFKTPSSTRPGMIKQGSQFIPNPAIEASPKTSRPVLQTYISKAIALHLLNVIFHLGINAIDINYQPLATRQKGFVSVRDLIPHSPLV